MKFLTLCKGAVFALFLTFLAVEAGSGRLYLDLNGGYKTGTFGTSVRSDLVYCSSEFGYISTKYEASLTVPYLFLRNRVGNTDSSSTAHGIGDIIVRGGGVLLEEGESGFSLGGALAVKLATADLSKGLGSGSADIGVFVNANQRVQWAKLTLMLGYIKVGRGSTFVNNDSYLYGAGISRIFGFTNVYTSFEGRSAIITGAQNPAEIHAGIFHVVNKNLSIKGSFFGGLNNGGPRFGFETGISYWG